MFDIIQMQVFQQLEKNILMDSQKEVIRQIKQEFEAYLKSGQTSAFQPSPAAGSALTKLARMLELKRQEANLTETERGSLREIDDITEKMSNINRKKSLFDSTPPAIEPRNQSVYNLKNQSLQEEPERDFPIFVPKISDADADKIIATLNEQFEEKVLKKLKSRPFPELSIDQQLSDFSSADTEEAAGRSLQEYLSAIKAERPDQPFGDEDSDMDTSKQYAKINQRSQ